MKTINNRRKILKMLGSGFVAGMSPIAGLPRLSYAQMPSNNVVVVVFLRGGCDGLNSLIPKKTADFNLLFNGGGEIGKTMASTITVPTMRPSLVPEENSSLEIGDDNFNLHKNMTGLQSLCNAGKVTFFPATHVGINLDNGIFANMSHFTAQDIMERGGSFDLSNLNTIINNKMLETGWIARSIPAEIDDSMYAFGFGSKASLLGDPSILSVSDLSRGVKFQSKFGDYYDFLIAQLAAQNDAFQMLCESQPACQEEHDLSRYIQSVATHKIEQAQQAYENLKCDVVKEENIPDTCICEDNDCLYKENNLGNQLKQAAALIKGRADLQMVAIDDGGYDHHADMVSRLGHNLDSLSQNLHAFHKDLNETAKAIDVVVITEFGRTVDENGDGRGDINLKAGTDHGQAFTAFVMATGRSHEGYSKKICYGSRNNNPAASWPGLNNLISTKNGRYYLDSITDYRDILTEILEKRSFMLPYNINPYDNIFRQVDMDYVPQTLDFI